MKAKIKKKPLNKRMEAQAMEYSNKKSSEIFDSVSNDGELDKIQDQIFENEQTAVGAARMLTALSFITASTDGIDEGFQISEVARKLLFVYKARQLLGQSK